MNSVNLVGNLTADPELKYSQAGKAIAKGTIAVRRDNEKSDFVRYLAFGKTAEMIAEYFRKGSQIGVSGSIWTGSYEKDDGSKVYTTEVCVNGFTFVGGKKEKKESVEQIDDSDEFPFR